MGATHFVLVGTLAVAGTQVVSPNAESPKAAAPEPERAPQGKNPYARLFQVPPQDPSSPTRAIPLPQNANQKTTPRVVCGTVVVPMKPDADSKMIVTPRDDSPKDYKIRKITPRLCNE